MGYLLIQELWGQGQDRGEGWSDPWILKIFWDKRNKECGRVVIMNINRCRNHKSAWEIRREIKMINDASNISVDYWQPHTTATRSLSRTPTRPRTYSGSSGTRLCCCSRWRTRGPRKEWIQSRRSGSKLAFWLLVQRAGSRSRTHIRRASRGKAGRGGTTFFASRAWWMSCNVN